MAIPMIQIVSFAGSVVFLGRILWSVRYVVPVFIAVEQMSGKNKPFDSRNSCLEK